MPKKKNSMRNEELKFAEIRRPATRNSTTDIDPCHLQAHEETTAEKLRRPNL